MKILRAVMLSILVTLCVTAVAAVVLHVGDFGSDANGNNEVKTGFGRPDRVSAEDEVFIDTASEGNHQWRRAIQKPEGSEFWQFYPVIPDAAPGETVVLSASSTGFVDWEADPNHASVEFIEKSLDEELVHLSFIMPEEKVVIRALYNDVPINNDTAFVLNPDFHEYGAVISSFMPDGLIGVPYSVLVTEIPTDQEVPVTALWSWAIVDDWPLENIGLSYNDATRIISGTPELGATGEESATVTFILTDDAGVLPDIPLTYTINIWNPPVITAPPLPAGMVGCPYDVVINATSLPFIPGNVWTWTASGLPSSGLEFFYDGSNEATAGISGVPSGPAGTPINFRVTYTPDRTYIRGTVSVDYSIIIYDPPVIQSTGLFDGIVNNPYNASFSTVSPPPPSVGAGAPWTWSIAPGSVLPGGLGWDPDTPGAIIGTPTADDIFTFTVRYTPTQSAINGYVDTAFTVKIWAQPEITTASLDDTMLDPTSPTIPQTPPRSPIPDPIEPDYRQTLSTLNYDDGPPDTTPIPTPLPTGNTTWTWGLKAGDNLPPGLIMNTSTGAITGKPLLSTTPGLYSFTVIVTAENLTNPNINGATFERPLSIQVWARRYLTVNITATGVEGAAARASLLPNGEPQITDINSLTPSPDPTFTPVYTVRAVMPGTKGIVTSVGFGNHNFVRWEVESELPIAGSVAIGPNYRSNFMVGQTAMACSWITMPDGDVTIRGVLTDPPTITADLNPSIFPSTQANAAEFKDGVIGPRYTGSLFVDPLTSGFYGTNPNNNNESWEILGDPTVVLPPGITSLGRGNGTLSGFPVNPNPLQPQTAPIKYTFQVGLTLPGTMRIDRWFALTINPYTILRGDVDGLGTVDMADYIRLWRYLGDTSNTVNFNFDNSDLNRDGRVDITDFILLQQMFAQQGFELPPMPPPGTP